MHRRGFFATAAGAATWLVCGPSIAHPATHAHERLLDVWKLMARTVGGPGAIRAAVEGEFGKGLLRFVDRHGAYPDVLLDTTSIDLWRENGRPISTHAAAKVLIVGGGLPRSDRWIDGPTVRCDGRSRFG